MNAETQTSPPRLRMNAETQTSPARPRMTAETQTSPVMLERWMELGQPFTPYVPSASSGSQIGSLTKTSRKIQVIPYEASSSSGSQIGSPTKAPPLMQVKKVLTMNANFL